MSDDWQPSLRYPDPAVQVLDARFARYQLKLASVERLATGCRWSEGPVWFGDGRFLLWSDIPNDRILRWDEGSGQVSVFRKPSNHANGLARDTAGRLLTCEHGTRRVTRTEYDGRVTVLADRYRGKRLNSPNDIICQMTGEGRGAVWFTDPPFGILGWWEGEPATPELPQGVYRIDPLNGELKMVLEDLAGPNGLAFSPDEKYLYVTNWDPARKVVMRYAVRPDGGLAEGRVFFDMTGAPGEEALDGLKVDSRGNVFASGPGGVWILSPGGRHLGTLRVDELRRNRAHRPIRWGRTRVDRHARSGGEVGGCHRSCAHVHVHKHPA